MSSKTLHAAKLASTLQKLFPRELASSWDNVGLLLEPAFTRTSSTVARSRILLCIDLTSAVCQEALDLDGCAHIVSYHPIIFSGLKSLTLKDPQQRSLLRLAGAGISVYSPHTSIDAVKGGVNDMLRDAITKGLDRQATTTAVEPCKNPPKGHESAGLGRIVQIRDSTEAVHTFVQRVKANLGLSHIQFAESKTPRGTSITSVGLCAGSGGSVLKGCNVDIILTGELSHHEILAFVAKGTHVMLCGHCNTERPYLPTLKAELSRRLQSDGEDAEIIISKADQSPFITL